jgi:inorganic phosphate transporter, PiT family
VCVTACPPASVVAGNRLFAVSGTSSLPSLLVAPAALCHRLGVTRIFSTDSRALLNIGHFISAGMVSFARGLNDTPKLAGLLVAFTMFDLHYNIAMLAAAMAVGGLLNARKVAATMSRKITPMEPGPAFAANLVTAAVVIGASRLGLPVSTTHVSVGSISGIGILGGHANYRVLSEILLSWILTLPLAAITAYFVFATLL